jgi:hypothetical protein
MGGLVGYGAYLPHYRLERGRIAGVLSSGGGHSTRSVAGHVLAFSLSTVNADGREVMSGYAYARLAD